MEPPTPALLGRAPTGPADAYVLLLHGGRVRSYRRDRNLYSTSLMRMLPFDRELRIRANAVDDVVLGVQTMRYRYLGWNGAERSPVADTIWAIDHLRECYGDDLPVVLLGHSMGCRVAAWVAEARPDNVRGAFCLAPWWPDREGLKFATHQSVYVLHGTRDFITSARSSRRQSAVLAERGIDATWGAVERGGHYMVHALGLWHELATSWTTDLAAEAARARRGVPGD